MPKDALIARIKHCALCTDLPKGPKPIVQLSPRAKILIASQAPGSIAHASGVPFQDPSGRRLRSWMGLEEDKFYNPECVAILPMGFCYPGKGKGGDLPPRPLCAETWREEGLAYLLGVQLTLLIGKHSLGWHAPHLKNERLSDLAKAQPLLPLSMIILPHPSPRNTPWLKAHPWFERDIVPRLKAAVSDLL